MARLLYASNMSLDGWTEDSSGALDWAPPDDEVFAAITAVMHSARTYLYGRRMYETMAVWETDPSLAGRSALAARYAQVWGSADKVVHSTTLDRPVTARTRIERNLDADAVRTMKSTATADLLIGGPNLAAQALAAGLVDEIWLYVWPIVLGGRTPALPPGQRIELELLEHRPFAGGAVQLRYQVR